MRTTAFLLVTIGLASTAEAEPTFLAKQYTRCTACHYSPTGGGLLTPYGRLLSHRELSTSGGAASSTPDATDDLHGEPAFLFGALGNVLGPVHLGLELRPAHLGIGFPGGHQDIDFLMNADLVGALQNNGWTAYATIGREPPNSAVRNGRTQPTAAFISYEHWISYQTDKGVTIRAGRFMPAYGVAFADHTAYTRIGLDHDRNQVYGLEVSDTIGPSLVQVMVGPGKAEAILHASSRRGFSTAGRGSSISRPVRPSSARLLSPRDRGGSEVRRRRNRLRLRAYFSRVDLDGSGYRPGNESRRRALVRGRQ